MAGATNRLLCAAHALRCAPVFQRLAKLLVLLAAVQLLGGHWVVLQSAAWVGMLVSYSQGESVVAALEKTFDGAHPCDLCKVVKSGRDEEQRKPVVETVLKQEAVLVVKVEVPRPAQTTMEFLAPLERAGEAWSAVPTQPPRAV